MDSKLAKVYLLDKTKTWFGFGDLDPVFKVTGEFSLKIFLEPVDGFHLIQDRYIVKTSQRCGMDVVTFHFIFEVKDSNVTVL